MGLGQADRVQPVQRHDGGPAGQALHPAHVRGPGAHDVGFRRRPAGRVDVRLALVGPVVGQGEVPGYSDERVFLGKRLLHDTAPPVIAAVERVDASKGPVLIRARVHDHKSPSMPQDWRSVTLDWTVDGRTREVPMRWYGEYLWRASLDAPGPPGDVSYRVCATDAAGNRACSLGSGG